MNSVSHPAEWLKKVVTKQAPTTCGDSPVAQYASHRIARAARVAHGAMSKSQREMM